MKDGDKFKISNYEISPNQISVYFNLFLIEVFLISSLFIWISHYIHKKCRHQQQTFLTNNIKTNSFIQWFAKDFPPFDDSLSPCITICNFDIRYIALDLKMYKQIFCVKWNFLFQKYF